MWTPVGDKGRKRYAHLHGSLTIAGTAFHANAIQVNKFGQAISSTGMLLLKRVQAVDPDCTFRTSVIGGRDYVIYLTPWGK
jgi:hypothetical protein